MRPAFALGLVSLTLSVGCGMSSMNGDDEEIPTSFNCSADHRSDTFAPDLEKVSDDGAIDFKLVSAEPSPPSRGDNTWVVQLNLMADGTAMEGIEGEISATPFMPDHQHGSPIHVEVAPVDGTPGQYTLEPVNLWMPGVWQTTIAVSQTGGVSKAVYTFCLSE